MDKFKRRERLLIRSERIPRTHLSEEAQLLAEGRLLFSRAMLVVTRTSSIKVWVPLLCSMILTGYYLYTLHRKTVTLADVPSTVAEAAPKAVADNAPAQASASTPIVASASASADNDAGDDYAEIQKEAEQAHSSQQFADEARLWQAFMDHAPLPQQACPAIGRAYERVGQIDKSVEAFEKCVSLDPGNLDILIAFAHALQTKSDFSRAAELYRQCLSKDPRKMDARTGLALIALKQNHLDEAGKDADGVLHVAPDNTDALLIAGIVAWREGKLQDAEQIFLKGVGLDDKRADFHAFLGRIAEAERRPQQALRQYDKVLELDPNDTETAERRDRLQGVR
jgi:tetratricopeptide (TPR) repeat protein